MQVQEVGDEGYGFWDAGEDVCIPEECCCDLIAVLPYAQALERGRCSLQRCTGSATWWQLRGRGIRSF